MFYLVARRDCFCMARWNCKHPCIIISKKHPVLNNIVLWRKLHTGKQQYAPHMALLFPLEVFISSPEPAIHQIMEKAVFCSWWWNKNISSTEKKLWRRLLGAFVCIECPWTSLARVLIKSLLAIPWRSPVWVFPCHHPPPISRSFPLFPSSLICPLNSPQSPVPHQSFDRGFLFPLLKEKSWLHVHVMCV